MIRLAIFLALLPVVALSDPVAIRSGEHDTFSRLVLSIGVDTGWSITPSDDGFTLQLDGPDDGFDVSSVFERIPRDRLLDVTQTAPTILQLQLACACGADAFLWRPGELVIDLVDPAEGAPDIDSAFAQETAPSILMAEPETAQVEFPNLLLVAPPSLQAVGPVVADRVEPDLPENDLADTERALAEGIARAASQGFLTPSVMISEPEPEVDQTVEAAPMTGRPGPDIPEIASRPGVGISTALDREFADLGALLEAEIGQGCLPGELYQVDTWGDESGFHQQVAALAEDLAGEFGEEPLGAQDTLARLYIYFGFGAEAQVVLAADRAASQSRFVMSELAGIVDDAPGPYPLTAAQADCATAGAMWAFMIDPAPLESDTRNQVMQSFFGLPQPLRGQLSSRMARQFIQVGDGAAAERLLQAAGNSDAGETHEVQAARALLAEDRNDPDEAVAVLSQQANDNARTSPESLIRLIDLQLAQGLIPAEADLLLVATMRQEFRDTPTALTLAEVEARGLLANAQYQPAIDLLDGRDDDAAHAIVDQTYGALVAEADAGTFLGFAYGDLPNALTAQTENALAHRLIDLGFADRAIHVLQGPATRDAAAERRYLRAEAAIGTGDFASVIDVLTGLTDERARVLRAQAFEGRGEHGSALAALTPDQETSTPTLQFRASAWERLTVEDDEVLSSFANAVLTPPNTNPIDTLADRRALLSQSEQSRRAVEDLLLRFDGTTPAE